MTKEETQKILMGISCSYPNFKPQAPIEFMVEIWADDFAEYSYEQVYMALKTFKATDKSGFAPSIGQLIDKIHSVREMAAEETESMVWQKVMKAIGNSNYHATEEFEKLDPIAQKVIGSPEQLKILARDDDFNESVQKSLFMRNYAQLKNREKEFNRLPETVKQTVLSLSNNQNLRIEG